MPRTTRTRRSRASSPTRSSRSATTISTAYRRRRSGAIPTARARCSPMPPHISAIPRRSIIWRGSLSTASARWFGLSAQKGQCQSQAMLGAMLFAGDHVPRQAARGLMWLTLAKDSAKEGAATDQDWINRLYDSAFQQATEDERALALVYLKRWMETRRE